MTNAKKTASNAEDAKAEETKAKAEETKAETVEAKSEKVEEGIFGGPVTPNNPREEDLAYDGRK